MFYFIKRLLWWLPNKIIIKVVRPYLQNIDFGQQLLALKSTSQYVTDNLDGVASFKDILKIRDFAIREADSKGLHCEFGVWRGSGINFFADRTEAVIHGFDSFEGLPETFGVDYPKGRFSLGGKLPKVRKNVKLHVGWFDKTLPKFKEEYSDTVSFIHIDCDLYVSTKVILDSLSDRIIPGTVILFDEYFNYATWQKHEYKAFQEFVAEKNLNYEYIGYTRDATQVCVKIK